MSTPLQRYYYVADYMDEVMPCAPTLAAWAKWLSEPDESWPHELATDGQLFTVTTIDVLAVLDARRAEGVWTFDGEPPAGATGFVCRSGRSGWDAETWSETPLGHLNDSGDWYSDGDEEEVVCTCDGPELVCRFEAAGPHLVIEGPRQ